MKFILTALLVFTYALLSACQIFEQRQKPPAEVEDATVKNATLDAKINPTDQEISVLETMPLMNNAVASLYNQAQAYYQADNFEMAIVNLERAYEIQPNLGQVSQLLAEIYMHKGDFEQAHYWSSLATKNAPSKGKSCEKSWRILALAAENLGYYSQQTQALENKDNCIVKAGNRF